MSSAQIPSTQGIDPVVRRVLDPIKENIEVLKGRRGDKIQPLQPAATLADVINKLNELIAKLQD